ncbi:carboxylesterase/lipase family protein [Pseudoteredinibacter isoporae]|uniref:Carboxylic ester hydrolase n=1 Tax=Pseudoteredinibacter isoporae TaxID=570281 RepID=A0A7X0MW59_9GAMM|nr:carboxylesterase family protein [Pseudoteredinibacter isoporae]MBB6522108.1 para-nitrobenzyl esterase [Pseudoteredinibacter isoporae]NHO87643.1 carboxylesterase family protein [Pseudoteredinibacter isoporae]NIB24026.1 carboxylesterase family protein [Pseudoteredinibacter isoporae]
MKGFLNSIKTLAVVLAGLFLLACAETEPKLESLSPLKIKTGEIIGQTNALGGRQWRGIPYAKPPIGDLRWRAPQPVEPWDKALLTQEHSSACSQMSGGTGDTVPAINGIGGSEDCLYLNVYAPKYKDGAEPQAVMVWVHGGSNTHGSANIYDGSRLATEHNVVVVTINYRLGPFGWLRHPALAIENDVIHNSGNFGTLDIIQSLHWVKNNIAAFGGDPERVTLFGESAGGFNTLSLMLSPMAKGLFHRAIVQSGGLWFDDVSTATAYPEDGGDPHSALELERQLRNEEGWSLSPKATRGLIKQQSLDDRARFLRQASVAEIFDVYKRLGETKPDIPRVFQDGVVISAGDPVSRLSVLGEHYNVPVIIGSNRDETKLYYYQDPKYVDLYFDRYAIIKNEHYYDARAQYHSERWKYQGVDRIANALSQAKGAPVWAYRFDWDEQARPLGMKLDQLLGASHGMEIPFVFGFTDSGGLFDPMINRENTPGRESLSQRMRSLWTRFAKSGDPNSGQSHAWYSFENPNAAQFAVFDTNPLAHSLSVVDPDTFHQRIVEDSRLASVKEKCEVWASLIRKAPELWPEENYSQSEHLDCSAYPYESLQ